MTGTDMSLANWNPGDKEVLDKYFPKYYKLNYDNTSSKSGCFHERPGWLQFNLNLMDKDVKENQPFKLMDWIDNTFLQKKEID